MQMCPVWSYFHQSFHIDFYDGDLHIHLLKRLAVLDYGIMDARIAVEFENVMHQKHTAHEYDIYITR